MAIDLQRAVDQLLAMLGTASEAELHLTPPAALLHPVLDDLHDAIYRAQKLDQSNWAHDLAIARVIATGGRGS